jgi:CRISPR/Cas system-associated exonuclease Cas4 (RecB family)
MSKLKNYMGTKIKAKENPKIKISQSLMKTLFNYKIKEECGLVLKAKYIDGKSFPSSPAMELGNYFEYICTGALTRDGRTPVAETLKSGKLTTPYERINKQKETFDAIMKEYDFEIKHKGYVFQKSKYSGIADIIAYDKINKRNIIIDIKTSGLINDKWSNYGWHEDSIENKDELLIQAVHYKMLYEEEFGEANVPFYFFVFSTQNDWEAKIFEIEVSETSIHTHKLNLINAEAFFESEHKNGWKAYPSYEKCKFCPLKDECTSALSVPKAKKVYY